VGEDLAAAFLERRGFRILEKRFRRKHGEIDLICSYGSSTSGEPDAIVFVEVKTRSNRNFGRPESAIPLRRQLRVRRTAECFLAERDITARTYRFDVIAIDRKGAEDFTVRHIEDAFLLIDEFDESDPTRVGL
jgi:putative endonuclease